MSNYKKSILLVLLMAFSWTADAGWEITYRNNDSDGLISYNVMLIEDNMIMSTGNDAGFIYDVKKGEFTWLIAETKQYWKGEVGQFRRELENAMKLVLDEMLNSLPEEQRAMYAQMIGGMSEMYATPTKEKISAVNLKVTKTGETLEIAGYSATKYELFVDDKLLEQLWLSTDFDVSDDIDIRTMVEMFNEIKPNVEGDDWYEYTDEYLKLFDKGFRMKSVDSYQGQDEVIKIVERKIGKSEFEVPADYSPITIQELLQQQMMHGSGEGGYDDGDDGFDDNY